MKFLCDHDVAADVARVLRARGYAVIELREVLPPDTPDAAVWAHAREQGLILLTCNRADFLALAQGTAMHPGLILLFRRRTHQAEASRLLTTGQRRRTRPRQQRQLRLNGRKWADPKVSAVDSHI